MFTLGIKIQGFHKYCSFFLSHLLPGYQKTNTSTTNLGLQVPIILITFWTLGEEILDLSHQLQVSGKKTCLQFWGSSDLFISIISAIVAFVVDYIAAVHLTLVGSRGRARSCWGWRRRQYWGIDANHCEMSEYQINVESVVSRFERRRDKAIQMKYFQKTRPETHEVTTKHLLRKKMTKIWVRDYLAEQYPFFNYHQLKEKI